KSAGNGFLPQELFTGDHPLLERGYSPMSVRFFMLQAHYRSTLDFSNQALDAADKGYKRLMNAVALLNKLTPAEGATSLNISELDDRFHAAMDDDFNSPVLIAELFEVVRLINRIYEGKVGINPADLEQLTSLVRTFVFDVLGLKEPSEEEDGFEGLMNAVIALRDDAKRNKDYATSDRIREELNKLGIQLKDS